MSRSAMRDISALSSSIKIDRLIGEKFANNAEAIEKAMNETAERVNKKTEEFNAILSSGVAAQLEAFRKDVGEEMWKTISNNPNLLALLQQWVLERSKIAASIVVEEFKTLLPDNHGMTDQEILEVIVVLQKRG